MKFLYSLAVFALLASSATAQDVASFYKGKTVRIVVGFSAGGGYDHYARVVARHIGRYIPGNPTVIVQNMPGAASLKSVRYLTSAAPTDGTLINAFNPGLLTQALTNPKKVDVNFLDVGWIGSASEDFRVCYTWNATGMMTWDDFVKRPQVNFGVTGVGTASYIELQDVERSVWRARAPGHRLSRHHREAHCDRAGRARRRLPRVDQHPGALLARQVDDGPAAAVPTDRLRPARKRAGGARSSHRRKQAADLRSGHVVLGGRAGPISVPKAVPADRQQALRAAFEPP